MTKMLRIVEIDQTTQPAIALADFSAPNEFIASLVAQAARDGQATAEDNEGCPVTATVWDDEDSAAA